MQERGEPRSTVRGFCWVGVVLYRVIPTGIKMLVYHYILVLLQS